MSDIKKWDKYFYDLCEVVAKNSKCLSRQIGSILVRDKSIISSGYNGPPRDIPHCNQRHLIDPKLMSAYLKVSYDNSKYYHEEVSKCPRQIMGYKSGKGLDWCVAGHSERNTLINAAREGISTKGTKLYMNCGIPCSPCMIEIVNAGVEEIIVTKIAYYDISSEYLLKNSKIKYRLFTHIEGVSNENY